LEIVVVIAVATTIAESLCCFPYFAFAFAFAAITFTIGNNGTFLSVPACDGKSFE
jgi:hypothetical protein